MSNRTTIVFAIAAFLVGFVAGEWFLTENVEERLRNLDWDRIKTICDVSVGACTVLAALATAWWFFYTNQIKQRIQFDVELNVIAPGTGTKSQIAEIAFIFENKGFVEHYIWDLKASVHTLQNPLQLTSKKQNNELIFDRCLLSKTNLVRKDYEYYFVRPGVRQVITHIIEIPTGLSVVRVTASFHYNQNKDFPHTVRRVFALKT
jgi:hypothetical protein